MISIMDSAPLLHEPGVTITHADCESYHRLIEYKNIDFAMCKLLEPVEFKRYIPLPAACYDYYIEVMRTLFTKNKDAIHKYVNDISVREPTSLNVSVSRYGMNATIYYNSLKDKIKIVFQ
jgi:hypothetical protein